MSKPEQTCPSTAHTKPVEPLVKCTALHCYKLNWTRTIAFAALYSTKLHYTTVHYHTLHQTTLHYSIIHCITLHCINLT